MKQYALTQNGLDLLVEFDQGATFWYRARLIVNNEVVDERSVFWGTTRLRASQPRPVVVEATAGFLGPKRVVLHEGGKSIPFTKEH